MSVGTNTPFGFRPVRYLNGTPYTGGGGSVFTIASAYATNLIPGDPVTLSGTAGNAGPGIVIGANGGAIIGIFGGIIQYFPQNQTYINQSQSWTAGTILKTGTECQCLVYTDPNLLFAVQMAADDATVPRLLADDVGLNGNFFIAAGNLATNTSGVYLNKHSVPGAADTNCKILGLAPGYVGNAFNVNYNVALVKINNHVFNGGTGTAGI